MSRLRAYSVSAILVGLTAFPVALDSRKSDSYPLSTYPMFSTRRDRPKVHHVVGIDAEGARVILSPQMVANEEVMQAAQTVAKAVVRGKKARAELCRDVAARVAAESAFSEVEWIHVVTDRYDAIAYFTEGPEPVSTKVRAKCPVKRGS